MTSESPRWEVPESGVVTFAHCVVVRGRAELQALGQQPCRREGQLSRDWTRLHTRAHALAATDISHSPWHAHSSTFPETHGRCAQSKHTPHVPFCTLTPTQTRTHTPTHLQRQGDSIPVTAHTRVHTHSHTRVQIHNCINVYADTPAGTCTDTRVHGNTRTCAHTRTHRCTHTRSKFKNTQSHVQVTQTCTHVGIHTHTCTHINAETRGKTHRATHERPQTYRRRRRRVPAQPHTYRRCRHTLGPRVQPRTRACPCSWSTLAGARPRLPVPSPQLMGTSARQSPHPHLFISVDRGQWAGPGPGSGGWACGGGGWSRHQAGERRLDDLGCLGKEGPAWGCPAPALARAAN